MRRQLAEIQAMNKQFKKEMDALVAKMVDQRTRTTKALRDKLAKDVARKTREDDVLSRRTAALKQSDSSNNTQISSGNSNNNNNNAAAANDQFISLSTSTPGSGSGTSIGGASSVSGGNSGGAVTGTSAVGGTFGSSDTSIGGDIGSLSGSVGNLSGSIGSVSGVGVNGKIWGRSENAKMEQQLTKAAGVKLEQRLQEMKESEKRLQRVEGFKGLPKKLRDHFKAWEKQLRQHETDESALASVHEIAFMRLVGDQKRRSDQLDEAQAAADDRLTQQQHGELSLLETLRNHKEELFAFEKSQELEILRRSQDAEMEMIKAKHALQDKQYTSRVALENNQLQAQHDLEVQERIKELRIQQKARLKALVSAQKKAEKAVTTAGGSSAVSPSLSINPPLFITPTSATASSTSITTTSTTATTAVKGSSSSSSSSSPSFAAVSVAVQPTQSVGNSGNDGVDVLGASSLMSQTSPSATAALLSSSAVVAPPPPPSITLGSSIHDKKALRAEQKAEKEALLASMRQEETKLCEAIALEQVPEITALNRIHEDQLGGVREAQVTEIKELAARHIAEGKALDEELARRHEAEAFRQFEDKAAFFTKHQEEVAAFQFKLKREQEVFHEGLRTEELEMLRAQYEAEAAALAQHGTQAIATLNDLRAALAKAAPAATELAAYLEANVTALAEKALRDKKALDDKFAAQIKHVDAMADKLASVASDHFAALFEAMCTQQEKDLAMIKGELRILLARYHPENPPQIDLPMYSPFFTRLHMAPPVASNANDNSKNSSSSSGGGGGCGCSGGALNNEVKHDSDNVTGNGSASPPVISQQQQQPSSPSPLLQSPDGSTGDNCTTISNEDVSTAPNANTATSPIIHPAHPISSQPHQQTCIIPTRPKHSNELAVIPPPHLPRPNDGNTTPLVKGTDALLPPILPPPLSSSSSSTITSSSTHTAGSGQSVPPAQPRKSGSPTPHPLSVTPAHSTGRALSSSPSPLPSLLPPRGITKVFVSKPLDVPGGSNEASACLPSSYDDDNGNGILPPPPPPQQQQQQQSTIINEVQPVSVNIPTNN